MRRVHFLCLARAPFHLSAPLRSHHQLSSGVRVHVTPDLVLEVLSLPAHVNHPTRKEAHLVMHATSASHAHMAE